MTIGLVALLECSVGDVVEFAPTGKDVEGAGVTDILVTSLSGVGKTFFPTPTQVENPKRSTNFEAAYSGNCGLGTPVGLVIV